ncbi:endo-beta-1,6-glucanase [Colletotrichum higginsianum]|uniref:glucan endo-1,6-beta-glucosidase n=1 Tax=Colletotrichum higginsianum (strain IMI 349063) TaxID=759273 RepID=H1VB25_COLHI|nr:Endo-beta-1,6-glucanase [Colletotrichum higginsianum IMI 349063]OBR13599.1 Endo-beta-1,6-glucanase [Colletotrichum higginsianum IMI 349063]CCF37428.1 endo-beta-1,6-glucanase [Colletotrichum higginsianum]
MVRLSLLALAAVAHFSYAWLPSDGSRKLLDTRGFSLFDSQNTSTIDDSDDIGKRWWTASGKIRGVNLGSLFVFEPWIANGEWNNIGCGGQQSEFDCVMNTGQERSDAAFQKHWDTWITEGDLDEMMGYGINTIRIPLGYWLDETLVDKNSEHFPRGALKYLIRLCGWASDRGFYIILDQHGAPGAQVARNSFTGQFSQSPGFYNDYQYGRSIKFLEFLRKLAHDHSELRNVGTIQLVNEPTNWDSSVQSLRSTFYKNAYNAIRKVERDLGVTPNNYVHIQMMSSLWGSGNPVEFLDDTYFTAFDDHRYLKWANKNDVPWTHESYISTSCADNRNGDVAGPTIVGEWSISPPDEIESSDGWNRNTQKDFYRRWFAAQVLAYERSTAGWVFWTWKAQLNDYRWSYRDAVIAGVVPRDLNSIANSGVCG